MRVPFTGVGSEADTRQTTRFLVAVKELENYANLHRFEGAGSFYAWERLNILIGRLRAAYDLYELEGDVSPVMDEVEAFFDDLQRLHIKPDQWVVGHLTQFMAWLEEIPTVTVLTSIIPPAPGAGWPGEMLAVHPKTLEALLQERANASSPYPPRA